DQGVIDSGCSRHMTGNMSYLTDYEEIDGGYVAFGGNPKRGKITGNLDFENIKRLHDDLEVTAAKVCVTAAKLKLVLFINSNEKYSK
ncbi:hypothetical protein Tco_0331158, partial [Tanacetum coccineum]